MKISVVIPVRNEEKSIGPLLDALLTQSLPPDEIIITDGGSLDQTIPIIQRYIQQGAPIKLIRTAAALPGRGRNLAAARASNEWLAFTDAGIKPNRDWLAALTARAQEDDSIDVVYGDYEPTIDTFFKECATISYVSPPAEIDGARMRQRSVASMLLRRAVWESVGGFPEHLRSAEDLLFMDRIDQQRLHIAFAPRAVVYWELQPTLWRTFRRFTIYARNNIRAGLWRQWQAPILSRYLVIGLLCLPSVFLGARWLALPLALWLLMLLARGIVAIRRNQLCYPAGTARNLARLLVLVPLIAVLDAGAMAGTLQWLVSDKLRSTPGAVMHGPGH